MSVLLHADLLVESMERAVEFFVKHFGCSVAEDTTVKGEIASFYGGGEGAEARLVFLRFPGPAFPGSAMIELVSVRTPEGAASAPGEPKSARPHTRPGSVANVSIVVKALDEKLTELARAGTDTMCGPLDVSLPRLGQSRIAFVRGPEGVVIELVEPQTRPRVP
jgi:catechol 2,3-dioxygenase-like lactoylglutathione lyase family enzyme